MSDGGHLATIFVNDERHSICYQWQNTITMNDLNGLPIWAQVLLGALFPISILVGMVLVLVIEVIYKR